MRRSPQHIGRKGHQFLSQALRPRRIVLYVVFVLLGAVLSVVGIYGISALKLYTEANRFISASENLANTALGCGGGGNIGTSAREMVTSTRALRDELDKSQWTFLRDHTAYGNDITAARTMLDAMGNLVDGPFTDLMDLSKQLSGFSMKDKSVDLSAVTAMPGIVKQARADIKVETRRLEKLAPPKSSSIASMVKTGVSGLKSVDKMLDEYDELINLLPQLLGENGERTYLVAIYNPAELRSGGGMVGNIAPVTADHGKVTIGDFIATTDITYGTQPYDAENVKEAAVFGDQVWKYPQTTTVNPNFQRAAVTLKNMWLAQPGNENQEIAGVFALDPVFLQSLIGATGSVKLSDGKVLDGTNTVKFFLNELYVDHPIYKEQNAYTNKASKTIMTHVFSGAGTSTLSPMLKALRQTSANGHFKLWMAQEEELAALVQTKVFDANVAGMIPGSVEQPKAGVYVTEAKPSKLSWYLEPSITVKKTCGSDFAAKLVPHQRRSGRARPSYQPMTIANAGLGDEIHGDGTVEEHDDRGAGEVIAGVITGNTEKGTMQPRLFLMAPEGGAITSLAYESGEMVSNGTVEDRQFINLRLTQGIKPGETVTIAFTVRAAEKAKSTLDVVTTPIINEKGIYTGTNGKVTDTCGADVPDAVEDQWAGTGSDGTDGGKSSGKTSSKPADENKNSTDSSNGGVLDKLSSIKDGLSCPVDLKKFM